MKVKGEVPDGGWGWAVVSGTALINVFNQSLLSLFGLIFGPTLQSIAGSTGVTTVMSINCTISNFSGLLISPLSKYFSTKQITQIGVFLVSAGLALSTYSRSYTRITIGYGVLTGLGLGLIASSTFLIINSYFNKKKSQAVGFSMAGTSIGQMVMPLMVALLIDHYSYDGTILILAALSLHGLIGSMFFDPVSEHMLPKNKTQSKDSRASFSSQGSKNSVIIENNLTSNSANNSSNNNINKKVNLVEPETDKNKTALYIGNTKSTDAMNHKIDIDNTSLELIGPTNKFKSVASKLSMLEEEQQMLASESDKVASTRETSLSFCEKLVALFDFHILLDPIFVHIMIGLSMAYTTSISFSTFFPLFLTVDLDMTVIDASTCMSVLSFMDFVGRIVVPLITNRIDVTHRTVFIFGSFTLAICRSVLVMQTTYPMILLVSGISGLARAATVINQNLVIAEYSKEYVSSAVGLNMVSKGVFVLTIGRLLGKYKDSAHNYSTCIHILNLISISVAVSWSLEVVFKKLTRKKH